MFCIDSCIKQARGGEVVIVNSYKTLANIDFYEISKSWAIKMHYQYITDISNVPW